MLSPTDAKQLPQGTPTIIVPFRDNAAQDRAGQLKTFVTFMKRWHPDWNILIIEQSEDGRKFNRGALLNIGARLAAKEGIEYVIFHDVDLAHELSGTYNKDHARIILYKHIVNKLSHN